MVLLLHESVPNKVYLKSPEYDVMDRTTLWQHNVWIKIIFWQTHFSEFTPPCDLKIAAGHIATSIKFWLIVQPYKALSLKLLKCLYCREIFMLDCNTNWRISASKNKRPFSDNMIHPPTKTWCQNASEFCLRSIRTMASQ